MLHLILVLPLIYKLMIEERNYLLLQSDIYSVIILQLLRNRLSNTENPSTKLNNNIISDSNKVDVPLLTAKSRVIESDISNNKSSIREEKVKEESVALRNNLVNDSISSPIETIQYSTLDGIIQSKFRGTVVNVFLSNKDNISGEAILNFKEVITLKSGNVTVWVNPESIDAAF